MLICVACLCLVVGAENCGDANILMARIENLMNQWGRTYSRIDVNGNGMDFNSKTTSIHKKSVLLGKSGQKTVILCSFLSANCIDNFSAQAIIFSKV